MLPCNVRHYFVIKPGGTQMYGYSKKGKLGWIYDLPWLRPYLFCSQIEAQTVASKMPGIILEWPGRVYENSPTDNAL